MPHCEYIVYTGGKLQECFEHGKLYNFPTNKMTSKYLVGHKIIYLCEKHFEFVKDCLDRSEILRAKDQNKKEKLK